MDNKRGKGVIGIALAIIMVASIFSAITPSVSAAAVQLYKETYPDPSATYTLGEEINYLCKVTCPPPGEAEYDLGPVDVYDQLPNGTWLLLESGLILTRGSHKDYHVYYVVTQADVDHGSATNYLNVSGVDGNGQNVTASVTETSTIVSLPPSFDFTFNHTCCLNMTFYGSANDPGNITNHTWNFGPGEGSIGPTPGAPGVVSHVFSSGGNKQVTLSGFNTADKTNSTTKVVYVPYGPDAIATANKSSVIAGQAQGVEFDGCGSWVESGLTLTYAWTFDDGQTGSSDNECSTSRVVDGTAGTVVRATLNVSDGHCNDTTTIDIGIRESGNCTIRVYGRLDEGAGDTGVIDPVSGLHPENPPYTDPIGPFYPQDNESPRKDFITFDPIMMYHNDPDWDNNGVNDTVYGDCIKDASNPSAYDASDKIFKRMWYEPTEWYKDEDHDGELDLVLIKGDARKCWVNESMLHDYLATGWLIKPNNDDDTCGDIYAPSIKQEFTYMMLDSSVAPQPTAVPTGGISSMLLPAATRVADNGIDSFDMNGDGVVDVDDAVLIESEYSLHKDIDNDNAGIRAGSRRYEVLDNDSIELSGDETLVLTTKELTLGVGDELQFFDHKVVLSDVTGSPENPVAVLRVYYQGHTSPPGAYKSTAYIGGDEWKFYSFGIDNTGSHPQGPFFVHVTIPNYGARTVTLKIGRMFGNTRANIGANPYWNQKQFYVDGVCYNIVAIKAENHEDFKYVTIRQKLPKVAVKIPNHTQHLLAWLPYDILPEMPQYNMNHTILDDVQYWWTIPTKPSDKMGAAMAVPALEVYYVAETTEPRFHGELKEIYWEDQDQARVLYSGENGDEHWAIEWFQTLPWEYTQFYLPPYDQAGRYLFTSAFYAPEALGVLWDGPIGPEPMSEWWSQRVKFWYEDCSGPYFVDRDGSLRLYGFLNKGPGNYSAMDPDTGYAQENPAYTDPIAPFLPQADQAPEKDFVTFNPIIMYHNDPDWNNDGVTDTVFADMIKNDYYDASEKVFKRMWYEPIEWYKDEPYDNISRPNAHDGVLDVKLTGKDCFGKQYWIPITNFDNVTYVRDLIYRGVWIVPYNSDDTKADIYAPSIKQEFTYMMLSNSVEPQPDFASTGGGSSMLIPMASWANGNGIDSFDADGDGMPDRLIIQSEVSLRDVAHIRPLIMDNDGIPETLSNDGLELSGDETVIFTLDDKLMEKGDEIRFFDHRIVLNTVTGTPEAPVAVFDVYYLGDASGPIKKSTVYLAAGENAFFSQGIVNTGQNPQGPFFVRVIVPDYGREKAVVMVGRMFGNTWANVGHNDQWNQKQFYVDGVCYNVVAIKTDGQEGFKYITFRQKLPKYPVKIPNHTQDLKQWTECPTILPEMPPYNMNHDLILDVQDDWSHDKIGPVMAALPLEICWVRETYEPRFGGELKEIYWENDSLEHWTNEWFLTIPFEYTGFMLPPTQGLYLVTSAFYAPEAAYHIWDNDETNPMYTGTGTRLKWWFDPLSPSDLYVNPPPVPKVWSIVDWYDAPEHGGNGDGNICGDEKEFVNAVLDYIFAFGTGTYPFGQGGIFDINDLIDMFIQFAVVCTQ